MSWKNEFPVNPVDTFCKTDENLDFHLFWPYSGSKRTQNMLLGAIFFISECSSNAFYKVSCESSGNLQNLLCIWPISSLFGAKNDPTNGPRGPIYYTHLKVIPVSVKSSCVNPVETFCERDKTNWPNLGPLQSQKVPVIWPRVSDCIHTWKYHWQMAKPPTIPILT